MLLHRMLYNFQISAGDPFFASTYTYALLNAVCYSLRTISLVYALIFHNTKKFHRRNKKKRCSKKFSVINFSFVTSPRGMDGYKKLYVFKRGKL